MKRTIYIFLLLSISCMSIYTGCSSKKEKAAGREIAILENEKWWGGAVLDGRNSPFSADTFSYDQIGNCKGNQAQPLYLSNKGRYIWSDKPLKIMITRNKITVGAHGSEIITGKQGES